MVLQALLSSRERNNIRNAVTQRDKKLGEASLSPPYALFFIPQQVMALSHLLPLFKMVPVLRKYCIADHLFSWVGPARRGWAITCRSLPVFFCPPFCSPIIPGRERRTLEGTKKKVLLVFLWGEVHNYSRVTSMGPGPTSLAQNTT